MKTFPMFLKTDSRRIVIFGGGEQAAQKARLALKTEAEILIITHEADSELTAFADAGKLRITTPHASMFENTILAFIATGCKGADAAWASIAKDHNILTNVVDYPDLCDAYTPSIVDRSPVVVAIGTEGTAPVLGRQIKSRIEELLEPRLGDLAAAAGRLRASVSQKIPGHQRRDFWRWVFSDTPRKLFAQGHECSAIDLIKRMIDSEAKPEPTGRLTMLDVRAAQSDLLTLRAVNRLQNADVIFHEADCDASILELARRDAERVVVHQNPAAPIRTRVEDHANVVWLFGELGQQYAGTDAFTDKEGVTEVLPRAIGVSA